MTDTTSLTQSVDNLTAETSELLQAYLDAKVKLDTKVASAANSSDKAVASEQNAKASEIAAKASETASKENLDNAVAVVTGGSASLEPQAGKIPLANAKGEIDPKWLPEELRVMKGVEFEALRAANREKYSCSGPIHNGWHYDDGSRYFSINQGLWVDNTKANNIRLGRNDGTQVGNSKLRAPTFNINGVEISPKYMGLSSSYAAIQFEFPPAPKGTTSYDKATGVFTDFEVDVDSKYGDVASTQAEAIARNFEGLVKNGDFRFGDDGSWVAQTGISITTGSASLNVSAVTPLYEAIATTSGTEYIIEFSISNYVSGGIRARAGNVRSPAADYVVSDGVYIHRLISDGQSVLGLETGTSFVGDVDYVHIRKATNEVVVNPHSVAFVEVFARKVDESDPWLYPYGCLNSGLTSIDGIVLQSDGKAQSYHAMYLGQSGNINQQGFSIATASTDDFNKFVSIPENNVVRMNNGDLVQWTARARTVQGLGNGDWDYLSPFEAAGALTFSFNETTEDGSPVRVIPQGNAESITSSLGAYIATIGDYMSSTGNILSNVNVADFNELGIWKLRGVTAAQAKAYNGELYAYVIGYWNQLNQGAYHPSLNPFGTANFNSSDASGGGRYWYQAGILTPNTLKDCFTPVSDPATDNTTTGVVTIRGYIGSSGSHPDGRLYDGVYDSGHGGFVDLRLEKGAWGVQPIDFDTRIANMKNSTYRGREKLTFTHIETGTQTSSSSSTNAFTVDDVAKYTLGDLVTIVLDNVIVAEKRTISSIGTSNITFDGDAIVRTVDEYHFVVTTDLNTTVEGEFGIVQVNGNPTNILSTPALARGWMGVWGGIAQTNTYSRKASKLSTSRLVTTNNGATWSVLSNSGSSVENTFYAEPNDNAIQIMNYKTEADMTRKSGNAAVYGGDKGLSAVYATMEPRLGYGASLVYSVLSNVNTHNPTLTIQGVNNLKLLESCIASTGLLYYSSADVSLGLNLHSDLKLGVPNNSSGAAKFLFHATESDGLAGLNIIANELIYDTDWGDDSKMKILNGTFTDTNGNTCKSSIHECVTPIGVIRNEQ